MTSHRVLLLPGWLDSDADHWQSRWERAHGWQRVEQDELASAVERSPTIGAW
jgi:predicted alpha/beta hydrolase family esterase